MFTLGQAAKEVGVAKSVLSRAIKNGRMSARKTENGSFEIDPAELFRVFPKQPQKEQTTTPSNPDLLQGKLDVLVQLVATLESERDDLRARLDREAEERRKAQAQLTALLSDQRATAQAEPVSRKRTWFGWR